MEYFITETQNSDIDWTDVPAAEIDKFPFDKSGYKPRATAQVVNGGDKLFVRLEAHEEEIFASRTKHWQEIWLDSCLEFFIMPFPEICQIYINFEFNPLGAAYIGYGLGRDDRKHVALEDFHMLGVRVINERFPENCETEVKWQVNFHIPFIFLQKYCDCFRPPSLEYMRGNFYKCGQLPSPHGGCWSEVGQYDFHRPEDFGELRLLEKTD